MKKTKIIAMTCLLACLISAGQLFAQSHQGIDLRVRLYDQRIYFPNDPVLIRLTISNDSPDTYRFKLADRRLHNVDFDVRGMDNSSAAPSQQFITMINDSQRVSYREVDLLPGEELSFVEDLSSYRNLQDGIYVIHARFFPELKDIADQHVLMSNSLTLSVRQGFDRENASEIRVQDAVMDQMQQAALPPDEVVAYMLDARMRSARERFLQYLDVERLYTDHPQRQAEYARLSAVRRRDVLEAYRDELWNSRTPEGISLIPINYQIQRTSYSPNLGTVTVEQRYDQGEFTEIKRFTYELERRDGIWYIVRYQVINLGTE